MASVDQLPSQFGVQHNNIFAGRVDEALVGRLMVPLNEVVDGLVEAVNADPVDPAEVGVEVQALLGGVLDDAVVFEHVREHLVDLGSFAGGGLEVRDRFEDGFVVVQSMHFLLYGEVVADGSEELRHFLGPVAPADELLAGDGRGLSEVLAEVVCDFGVADGGVGESVEGERDRAGSFEEEEQPLEVQEALFVEVVDFVEEAHFLLEGHLREEDESREDLKGVEEAVVFAVPDLE